MIELNEEQQVAVGVIQEHLLSTSPDPHLRLEGPAGVGKTLVLSRAAEAIKSKLHGQIVYTAPTNKAVRVLSSVMGPSDECRTIHSLLGLQMQPNGEIKELKQRDDGVDLGDCAAVVVDEWSMLGDHMCGYIRDAERHHPEIRWLYSGDPYQLPPVGEDRSPISELTQTVSLKKIMRQDNQILKFSAYLRSLVEFPDTPFELYSDHDDNEGIWLHSAGGLLSKILDNLDGFKDGSSRAIAWRNVQVDYWNAHIRDALFGEKEARTPWLPGDRVTTLEPARDVTMGNMMATTDEDGVVERADVAPHPIYSDFECWRIVVRLDPASVFVTEPKTVTFWVLHPRFQNKFQKELAKLAEVARLSRESRKKAWGAFWTFKESFHNIRHSYAITAHRSQGSTFQRTFVNWRDIMRNQNETESFRCLYVACTRPKLALYLG